MGIFTEITVQWAINTQKLFPCSDLLPNESNGFVRQLPACQQALDWRQHLPQLKFNILSNNINKFELVPSSARPEEEYVCMDFNINFDFQLQWPTAAPTNFQLWNLGEMGREGGDSLVILEPLLIKYFFNKSLPFPSVFILSSRHEIFPFLIDFNLISCSTSHQRLYLLLTSCININNSCNLTWQGGVKALQSHLPGRKETWAESNQLLEVSVFFSHRSNASIGKCAKDKKII